MSSALGQGQLMMYLFRWCKFSFSLAHLTQRVGGSIRISYPFPCSAVAFTHSGVTVIGFVAFVFLALMFLTEPPVR